MHRGPGGGGYSLGNNADDQATLQDIARDLPNLSGRLGSMKDEALARLYSPEYDTLRLRLEVAHAAVEAAAVEARRRMETSPVTAGSVGLLVKATRSDLRHPAEGPLGAC